MVAILFSGAEPVKQINTLSIEDLMWNLVKITSGFREDI